jgi:hypothetical protein
MTVMDVRIRTALAGFVSSPGQVEELVRAEDPDRPLGAVGDRLALSRPEQDRRHRR